MPYILLPRIESAAVTPNPAEINGAAALLVAVAEQQVWVDSSRYGSTRRWSMRASCTPESRSSAEAELPKFGQRPNLYVLCANL